MTRISLPRTVVMLGLVSFLTDMSSEMIYPLLPVFLAVTLGATAVSIGLIEGIAEATASLVKVYAGLLTDRTTRRKPLIATGYGLSGLVRPLIGLAGSWPVVLGFRFVDRVGKGIRSSPRDTLIAEVTPQRQRGKAYGLHRAMDHAGSVVGPLVAAALMTFAGFDVRTVFLAAAVPAALTMVVLILGVKDKPAAALPVQKKAPLSPVRDWKNLPASVKRLFVWFFLFTLGNSTDAFLLLTLTKNGVKDSWIVILWSVFHVVKMAASWTGGQLSDRIGHRPMIVMGWAYYALAYAAFAFVEDPHWTIACFLAYGLFFGFTEPSERALISAVTPPEHRGKAFGFFHFAIGLGALPASLLFGWLWTSFGPTTAFLTGAGLALTAAAGLWSSRFRQ